MTLVSEFTLEQQTYTGFLNLGVIAQSNQVINFPHIRDPPLKSDDLKVMNQRVKPSV